MLRVLGCSAPYVVPRSLGTDKDVLFDFNAWVPVNRTQRDAVDDTIMNAAQRSATPATELKAPRFLSGIC